MWDIEEHRRFLDALRKYGKSISEIAAFVGTKSEYQCRNHIASFKTNIQRDPSIEGADLLPILLSDERMYHCGPKPIFTDE